jgi:hypothetical protein
VCTFEQKGAGCPGRILGNFQKGDFGANTIRRAGWSEKFEGAIAKLQERPEPALRTGGCFMKIPTFVKGGNE